MTSEAIIIGVLAIAIILLEWDAEEQIASAYQKGYYDGLYQNVINMSCSDEKAE